MSQEARLIGSVQDAIGYLVLNRPDAHNAMTKEMWKELPQVVSKLKEEGARVMVMTGSGRSFAAGADLVELSSIDSLDSARDMWTAIRDCLRFLWHFELPTIAMINGPCLGGGCLLALACDLRYASRLAKFAVPVSRLGIVLDDENVSRLATVVGPTVAKELLLLGDTISSERAEGTGLVNRVVEDQDLASVVQEAALRISTNAPESIRQVKQSFLRSGSSVLDRLPGNEEQVIQSYVSGDFHGRLSETLD